MLAIFTTAAEAAGPELTTESFGAAHGELGEFHLPGSGTATLGDGKDDSEDSMRMSMYDASTEAFLADEG